MAIWLIRAGSHGEYEQKFIQENRVYVTWDGLDVNLAKLKQRVDLTAAMNERYPDTKPKAIQNWVSQVWPFAHEIKLGDWVILPLKSQPAIYIGEVTGGYQFQANGPTPFYHWMSVKWIWEAIPRANFSQDLLYSFGAFLTICRIQRNNAEQGLRRCVLTVGSRRPSQGQSKSICRLPTKPLRTATSKNWLTTKSPN
ncbi:restriction endonuclease [Methylomonas sp. TEB]|uniref:restriction endonuclease n=1 Tax=Methylomonas sp. TEB TaxID=3398229 RepID=UPI0039F5892E